MGADIFQQNRSAGFANLLRPCGQSHTLLIFNCLTKISANKTATYARLKQRFEKVLNFFAFPQTKRIQIKLKDLKVRGLVRINLVRKKSSG